MAEPRFLLGVQSAAGRRDRAIRDGWAALAESSFIAARRTSPPRHGRRARRVLRSDHGGLGTWALARPATAVMHEEGASATRFAGLAFDACAAPTRSTMPGRRGSSVSDGDSRAAFRFCPVTSVTSAPEFAPSEGPP